MRVREGRVAMLRLLAVPLRFHASAGSPRSNVIVDCLTPGSLRPIARLSSFRKEVGTIPDRNRSEASGPSCEPEQAVGHDAFASAMWPTTSFSVHFPSAYRYAAWLSVNDARSSVIAFPGRAEC